MTGIGIHWNGFNRFEIDASGGEGVQHLQITAFEVPLDASEIRYITCSSSHDVKVQIHPVELGSLSHDLDGFLDPQDVGSRSSGNEQYHLGTRLMFYCLSNYNLQPRNLSIDTKNDGLERCYLLSNMFILISSEHLC